jgi:hypothetical protein
MATHQIKVSKISQRYYRVDCSCGWSKAPPEILGYKADAVAVGRLHLREANQPS